MLVLAAIEPSGTNNARISDFKHREGGLPSYTPAPLVSAQRWERVRSCF